MNKRFSIYSELMRSIVINEGKKLNMFHSFSNAAEFIKIKNRGFAFIHINKNGGSSVEKALNIRDQIHLPFYSLEDYFGLEKARSLKICTIVRNPYDRVVSQYHFRLGNNQYGLKDKKITFKEFCILAYKEQNDIVINHPLMFKTQFEWLKDFTGSIDHIDYIGKFEKLNKSIGNIQKLLGQFTSTDKKPHQRKSKRGEWQDYYDSEAREIIYNYFEKDFDTFEYYK